MGESRLGVQRKATLDFPCSDKPLSHASEDRRPNLSIHHPYDI